MINPKFFIKNAILIITVAYVILKEMCKYFDDLLL